MFGMTIKLSSVLHMVRCPFWIVLSISPPQPFSAFREELVMRLRDIYIGHILSVGEFICFYHITYIKTCGSEPCIKGREKELHPTDNVGCNHLSMPLILASGTQFLICNTAYLIMDTKPSLEPKLIYNQSDLPGNLNDDFMWRFLLSK